jgi:hypothetical protein
LCFSHFLQETFVLRRKSIAQQLLSVATVECCLIIH